MDELTMEEKWLWQCAWNVDQEVMALIRSYSQTILNLKPSQERGTTEDIEEDVKEDALSHKEEDD